MIKIFSVVFLLPMLGSCSKYAQDSVLTDCDFPSGINESYSKKDAVDNLLQQYSKQGIPGLVVAVYTPSEGYWASAAGFASVESKIPMRVCQLQYLQSAAKMYMAAAILKLHEAGSIDLDAPITKYLPVRYSSCINGASGMTVRNLLNHESGMPDYLSSPEYLTYVLQHPDHYFSSEEILGYIRKEKQEFAAGSRFEYCNTNFHVLALITDSITGNHDEYIRKQILAALQLSNTFYRNITGHPTLVNSYLDRFGTGVVENVSQLQQVSISFSKGDDGFIATPLDAVDFLRGLMEGRLLNDSSLKMMMHFVNDKDGKPVYGMGLYYVTYSGQKGYGHGGAGAGAGCGLYYFPNRKIYVFLGTNIGTLVDGPITRKVNELKDQVLEILLTE